MRYYAILSGCFAASLALTPLVRGVAPSEVSGSHALLRRAPSVSKAEVKASVSSGQHILAAQNPTAPPTEAVTWSWDKDLVTQRGNVLVYQDNLTGTELINVRTLIEQCLEKQPVVECWRLYGSYEMRRLATEEGGDINATNGFEPNWMNHSAVKEKRLLDLTLPGSHHSGAYRLVGEHESLTTSYYGVITQNLSITDQLNLGIRLLHFRVAWGLEDTQLYISNGYLLQPLKPVLEHVKIWLLQHPSEVVIVDIEKDTKVVTFTGNLAYLKPMIDEDTDLKRVPGQMVHTQVGSIFHQMLALHKNLVRLPGDHVMENPTIKDVVENKIQVFYFWSGQQVLCLDFDTCSRTPGWERVGGGSLSFGPGKKMGERQNNLPDGGDPDTQRVMEPACIFDTEVLVMSSDAVKVAGEVKVEVTDMPAAFGKNAPRCYGGTLPMPPKGTTPAFYIETAALSFTKKEVTDMSNILKKDNEVYSRGEGYSYRKDAERLNFFLLTLLMQKGQRSLFTGTNAYLLDFPPAAIVERIIEAMQGLDDCGFGIYCMATGSCWSRSLYKDDGSTKASCEEETVMERFLADYTETGGSSQILTGISWLCCLLAILLIWQMVTCWSSSKTFTPNSSASDDALVSVGKIVRERQGGRDYSQACFVSGSDGTDGVYLLVEGERISDMPFWKWRDGPSWIFCGSDRKWYFGDEDEFEDRFKNNIGNHCSELPLSEGGMPWSVPEGGWMVFDIPGRCYKKCLGMKVSNAVPPDHQDLAAPLITATPSRAQTAPPATAAASAARI